MNFPPFDPLLKGWIGDDEKRKQNGDPWPSWLDDIFSFMPHNANTVDLLKRVNFFAKGVLAKHFAAAGFHVEFDDDLSGEENLKFLEVALDGREWHGQMLTKPESPGGLCGERFLGLVPRGRWPGPKPLSAAGLGPVASWAGHGSSLCLAVFRSTGRRQPPRRSLELGPLLFAIKNRIDTILGSIVTDLSVDDCLFDIGSVIQGRSVKNQDVRIFTDFDATDAIF